MRIFEQTEMTKLILTALKSYKNRGRINNKEFGNILQSYAPNDIEKCEELIQKIENEHLDISFKSRNE